MPFRGNTPPCARQLDVVDRRILAGKLSDVLGGRRLVGERRLYRAVLAVPWASGILIEFSFHIGSVPRKDGYNGAMRRFLAVPIVLVAIAGIAFGTASVSAASAPHQSLAVAMSSRGSKVQRLDGYTAKQPISVRVEAPHSSGVTLVGTDPHGGNVRVPLERQPDGRYTGKVTLATPGVWSLAVASQVDAVETASESFAISVVEGTPRVLLATVIGLALASIVAGITLIVVALRRPARTAT